MTMRRTPFIGALLAVVLSTNYFFTCPKAYSFTTFGDVALDAIALEIAKTKVSTLINDLKTAGQLLITDAGLQGSALESRLGNEANVLAENASLMFGDEMNKRFDQLTKGEELFLVEAERYRRDLKKHVDTVYDMKDTLTLDLSDIVSKSRIGHAQTFFVQRVDGLAMLPGDATYKITIVASRLGIEEGRKIDVKMTIDGKDIPPNELRVNNTTNHKLELFIPQMYLGDFNEEKLRLAQANVHIVISEGRKKEYDVPLYLSLYPHKAADLNVSSTYPTYDWASTGLKQEDSRTTANHDQPDADHDDIIHFPYDLAISVPFEYKDGHPTPGSKNLRNPVLSNIGGNPGFFHIESCAIQEPGSKAYASWICWSTPSVFKLSADIFEWRKVGEQPTSGSAKLKFDELAYVTLPVESDNFIVKVKTFTNKTYEFVAGKDDDPSGFIKYVGTIGDTLSTKRLVFRADRPTPLQPFENTLMLRHYNSFPISDMTKGMSPNAQSRTRIIHKH